MTVHNLPIPSLDNPRQSQIPCLRLANRLNYVRTDLVSEALERDHTLKHRFVCQIDISFIDLIESVDELFVKKYFLYYYNDILISLGRRRNSPQLDDKNMLGNIGDLFVKCI